MGPIASPRLNHSLIYRLVEKAPANAFAGRGKGLRAVAEPPLSAVVELGTHRFCELEGDHCMGIARFVQVWKRDGDTWKATRIISFGHRPLDGNE